MTVKEQTKKNSESVHKLSLHTVDLVPYFKLYRIVNGITNTPILKDIGKKKKKNQLFQTEHRIVKFNDCTKETEVRNTHQKQNISINDTIKQRISINNT